jgi:hypothetical protein
MYQKIKKKKNSLYKKVNKFGKDRILFYFVIL